MKTAPGPKGKLFLGSLPERRSRPLVLYLQGALHYGDVVRYRMGPFQVFLLSHPDYIKHVLQDNHRNYIKGKGYEKLFPTLGNGLLLSEGDFWHRQRRLAQPAFHRQRLAGMTEVMARSTAALVTRWRAQLDSGASFDVAQDMMRLTLEIVSRTLLGTDVATSGDNAAAVGAALTRLMAETNRRLLSVLPWEKMPLPRNAQFKRDLKTLDDVVGTIIAERRRTGEDKGDLLSMFMAARDEITGDTMTDKQLRDEVMTMFLAGHETTANLLAWTWVMLSRHPEIARRVRDEALAVLGPDRLPTFEDIARLRYTTQVLEESLRLYPPAWVIARQAVKDDSVGGYAIPRNSLVVLCPYVVHRLPKLWENPEGFDPDRFAPEAAAARPKYAYFPFSGGPRQCIGNHFAMTEATLIVALIARRYRLDLVPGHPIEPEPLITLRPKFGVRVTLHNA